MKKFCTALLFASGLVFFACEDPAEDLFTEVEEAVILEEIEGEDLEASSGIDLDFKQETD